MEKDKKNFKTMTPNFSETIFNIEQSDFLKLSLVVGSKNLF